MTTRDNILRAIRFEHPEHIPVSFHVNDGVFTSYDPHAVEELLESHPIIAGKHRMRWDLANQEADKPYSRRFFDEFGVEWQEAIRGIRGAVCTHPLEDFSRIESYRFPEIPRFDSEAERAAVAGRKAAGQFTISGLPHGHTFLRLTDLC